MNILLIGNLISDRQCGELIDNNIRPDPANAVQKYILQGMELNDKVGTIDAITAARVPGYPLAGIKRVKSEEWESGRCRVSTVGYINIVGLNLINRERAIMKAISEWNYTGKEDELFVIVYSLSTPHLKAAGIIKKKYPRAKVALIVTDLPMNMGDYRGIKKALKEMDIKRGLKYRRCIDKYCLYTKYMAEELELAQDKWMVFEGLIDTRKISCLRKERNNNSKKICIYAGSLDTIYATDKMVDAFEDVTANAELLLYGNPTEAEILLKGREHYKKTKYMGLCTQDEIFEKMKNADLLLNPRPTTLELTKFSCPSKTFEYMASGTPVLMTRLPGLPEEYYPYLYFFNDESKEGFTRKLNEVLNLDNETLLEKGFRASQFILNEKSAKVQTEKIIDFVYGQI